MHVCVCVYIYIYIYEYRYKIYKHELSTAKFEYSEFTLGVTCMYLCIYVYVYASISSMGKSLYSTTIYMYTHTYIHTYIHAYMNTPRYAHPLRDAHSAQAQTAAQKVPTPAGASSQKTTKILQQPQSDQSERRMVKIFDKTTKSQTQVQSDPEERRFKTTKSQAQVQSDPEERRFKTTKSQAQVQSDPDERRLYLLQVELEYMQKRLLQVQKEQEAQGKMNLVCMHVCRRLCRAVVCGWLDE